MSRLRLNSALSGAPIALETNDPGLAPDPSGIVTFAGLATRSAVMSRLFAALAAVAPTDLSLLLEGETGVGKEVLAEALHASSGRAHAPLVVFDCAAVSPLVAQSELFGCEADGTVDSIGPVPGALEQANRGTLVLDNVDALARYLQVQVNRALERRETRRLHALEPVPLDVRVITLTSRSLMDQARRGSFCQDLYRTLSDKTFRVPPLRKRREDLALLAERLLADCHPPRRLSDIPEHVWRDFSQRSWPGNVRELRNTLLRALLTPEHFEGPSRRP